MACCTGLYARYDRGLDSKDPFGLEGDPIALERTALVVILERQGGCQLFKALEESAVGTREEFGMFFRDIVDAFCGA